MQWVIMRNQPLTEVDNPLTRDLFNVPQISSKTLRNYILSLVPIVEDSFRSELPKNICLMLDGWSGNHVHYVAVFCTYIINGTYHETLIACAPLLKEDDLGADQHFAFLVESLAVYGRELSDVICIIGDNCSVNKSLAKICGWPLVGSSSHKFNLAVELWITKQACLCDAIKVIRELMTQIRTLKNEARLRELTHLRELLPNDTRWTGKCDMIGRFFRIEEFIKAIPGLDQHLPSASLRRRLLATLEDLKRFQSISISLQEKGLMLTGVQLIFDEVCEDYPIMSRYFSADADIVTHKPFEKAIMKIIDGRERDLDDDECKSVQPLKLEVEDLHQKNVPSANISYFERIQAKSRRVSESKSSYTDVNFIPATSCSVERLFSLVRWVLSVLRKRRSPILFEGIRFLKINKRLWNIKSVAAAMKLQPEQRYINYDDDSFYS